MLSVSVEHVGLRVWPTYHVCNVVQTANPLTVSRRYAGYGEDGRAIYRDACNANPLLQNLEPNDKLHSSSGMQLALLDAKEHGEITGRLRVVSLQLHDVEDVLVLGIGNAVVLAAKPAEYESGFIVSTYFREPSRTLRPKNSQYLMTQRLMLGGEHMNQTTMKRPIHRQHNRSMVRHPENQKSRPLDGGSVRL